MEVSRKVQSRSAEGPELSGVLKLDCSWKVLPGSEDALKATELGALPNFVLTTAASANGATWFWSVLAVSDSESTAALPQESSF